MTGPRTPLILLPIFLIIATPLFAEDIESRIGEIRAEYNAVQSENLQQQKLEWEGEGGEGGGSAILYFKGETLRAVDVTLYYPGHSFAEEHFYYVDGKPFFIFGKRGYWSFVANEPEKTIDKIWEDRLYLSASGEQVIRHLEKAYEGHTEEELKQQASEAANQDITGEKSEEAGKLLARAKSWLAIKNAAQALQLYGE